MKQIQIHLSDAPKSILLISGRLGIKIQVSLSLSIKAIILP